MWSNSLSDNWHNIYKKYDDFSTIDMKKILTKDNKYYENLLINSEGKLPTQVEKIESTTFLLTNEFYKIIELLIK